MPRQENYGQKIVKTWGFRPNRIDDRDWELISLRDDAGRPILEDVTFGTSKNDVVEIWIYDDINQIVAHTALEPQDEALRLTKYAQSPTDAGVAVGQDETPDMIEINWPLVMDRLELPEGRYFATINFFRNEVGSEFKRNSNVQGKRLFISEISPSRTELRLEPSENDAQLGRQIRNFAKPSVPPIAAQALVDQLYAHANATSSFVEGSPVSATVGQSITLDFSLDAEFSFTSVVDRASDGSKGYDSTVNQRLKDAGLLGSYREWLDQTRLTIRNRIVNLIKEASDRGDKKIQTLQLRRMIKQAIREGLKEMEPSLQDSVIAGRISLKELGRK